MQLDLANAGTALRPIQCPSSRQQHLVIFLQGGHSQLSSTAALPGVALHTEADLHIEVDRHTVAPQRVEQNPP